jgi:hypothetical protein
MGTILVNTTSAFSDGDQITSDSLNNLIDNAILNTTAVSSGTGLSVNGTTGVLSMDSSLTGKVLTGGSLNNAPIGASTPSTGAFTTLSSSSGYTGDVTGDVTGNITGNVTGGTGAFTTLSASGDISVDGSVKQSGNTGNLTLKGGDTDGANIELYGSNHATESIRNNAYYDAGVHVFRPVDGSSSSVVINSDGEVGIGEVSPTKLLHVKSPNSDTAETIAVFGNGDIADGLEIKTNGNGGSSLDWGFNAKNTRNLVFDTNQTERMRIDSSGNVGINTVTPQHKLDIRAESDAAISTGLLIANTASSSEGTGTAIRMVHSTSQTSNSASTISSERAASNGSIIGLNLSTDGSAAPSRVMTLLGADGNVGIGTETPSHTLDVNSGAINQVALFESTDETAYIELADSTGSVQFITYSSGALRIATGGAGAGSVGTSALFIDQSQNVGIGDDTPSFKLDVNGTGRFVGQLTLDDEVLHNISGTQARLPGYYAGTYGAEIEQTAQGSTIHIGRSNGNCMNIGADAPASPTQLAVVYFRDTSTGIGSSPQASNPVGNISITDSTIHFNSTSDYRLKENEVDITDGIDRLKELKPYRFNFTRNPSKVVDGFFAHEVSPVVPESISGEKDQVDDEGNPVYQGIDQSKLVPLLTAALQEAVAKIEALEARVQTLEG